MIIRLIKMVGRMITVANIEKSNNRNVGNNSNSSYSTNSSNNK